MTSTGGRKKFKVVAPCINQDTRQELQPDDIVEGMSAFEIGRHLAEGNIVPLGGPDIERSIRKAPERRRRIRKKNN